MATEKFKTLSSFSIEELKNELQETENAFSKLSFDHAVKGLENPLILRETRRDVARLKTELRRREIAEMDASALANRSKIRARRR